MIQFEQNLAQLKKIEALFKAHPKFPFLNWTVQHDEFTAVSLLLRYITKCYASFLENNWSILYSYKGFYSDPDSMLPLEVYGKQSKRYISISTDTKDTEKYFDNHFQVRVFSEDILAAATGDENDKLTSMVLGIDLRHPESLDKAREFMHAFFIEKLPLEEMEKKIERFERDEGYKFKRGAGFEEIKGGSGDYSSIISSAVLPKPIASVGASCPITGMWYCESVTSEAGIYFRKGDPMPGQNYSKEQQEAMEWRLVKSMDQA